MFPSSHLSRGENRGENLSDIDSILGRILRGPRATEALLVIAARETSGTQTTYKDLIEWLGVNDTRARKIVSKLVNFGLVNVNEGVLSLTDLGRRIAEIIAGKLGVEITADIARLISAVREKHVFYKVRRVSAIPPDKVFSAHVRPSAKIVLQRILWKKQPLLRRFSGIVYIAMDYERLVEGGESVMGTDPSRAERAELSGILRTARLFALSLPPNLLGEPLNVEELINDVGSRWTFASKLVHSRSLKHRYLEQVDALYLARFDKNSGRLIPLHETGLEAYEWLTRKLDSVISSIPDFYQPIAVSLYALTYNRLLTRDDILEGENDETLVTAREEAGQTTYAEVISKVFEKRLLKYRLVEILGRDKLVIPKSIFHRIVLVKGVDYNTAIRNVKMLLESIPEEVRKVLEYVIKNVSVSPRDIARGLGLSLESATSLVRMLSDQGLLIPSTYRYMWVGVAPARFIEDAIGRDLYIILYDITRRYEPEIPEVDLIELLERLIKHGTLDLYSYVSSRREYMTLAEYFFKLGELGLIKHRAGLIEPASEEAVQLIRVFTTVYAIPRGLDIIGGKVAAEASVLAFLRSLRDELLESLQDMLRANQ